MIKNVIMGFLVGLGKIIPGVSGAMIAISFEIYDKMIDSILNPIKNMKFLSTFGVGALISIYLGSNIIIYFIDNYYTATMLFFIGLISGSIPKIVNKTYKNGFKISNIITTFIGFALITALSLINVKENFIDSINLIEIILIGFIEACTSIMPGISGTAILMIFGYYNHVMKFFGNMLNPHTIIETIKFGIPFLIGILIGIIIIGKLVKYILNKSENLFLSLILGFVIATVLIMFKNTFVYNISLKVYIVSLLMFILGSIVSYKFDK